MTRLTDKEREALAWVENAPDGRTPVGADIHAAKILASCVTRLSAPMGGLETVAWEVDSLIKGVHYFHDVLFDLKSAEECSAALGAASKGVRELVLRSAAEAKIAGLLALLGRAADAMNSITREARESVEHSDWPEIQKCEESCYAVVKEIRALIETSGGEDANND